MNAAAQLEFRARLATAATTPYQCDMCQVGIKGCANTNFGIDFRIGAGALISACHMSHGVVIGVGGRAGNCDAGINID